MKTTKRKRVSAPAVEAASEKAKAPAAKAAAAQPTATQPTATSASTITLASHCSVKDAAALKDSLCRFVGESGAVILDVRSLERVDTATIQLLCAFVRARSERNGKVEWLGDSAALAEAARLLGVGSLLALPTDSTGARA
jgi:ABC-type transporter Mla MlaB component